MGEAKFNINEALKQTFGLYGRTPIYVVTNKEDNRPLPQYEATPLQAEIPFDSSRVAPMTGILIQDSFRFVDPTFALPIETVLELSRAKNIVKTTQQGRDGTVKEYISMDDWVLNFKGFIINYDEDLYPEDKVESMVKWFNLNQPMSLVSKWLSRWGIDKVVATNLKLPTFEGVQNVQPYELEMLSDYPITLEL